MLALEPLVHPLNLAQDGAQQNSMHRAEFAVSMSLTIFLDYVRGDSTCYVDGRGGRRRERSVGSAEEGF